MVAGGRLLGAQPRHTVAVPCSEFPVVRRTVSPAGALKGVIAKVLLYPSRSRNGRIRASRSCQVGRPDADLRLVRAPKGIFNVHIAAGNLASAVLSTRESGESRSHGSDDFTKVRRSGTTDRCSNCSVGKVFS